MSNQIRRDPNNLPERTAYRDGYQEGIDSERRLQRESYAVRESNSAASGLTLGLLLALIAGLVGGTVYFLTRTNEPTRQTAPATQIIPVPTPDNRQPQSSQNKTTIIDRTIEKSKEIVPVPAQPSPAPSASAPDININVPNPTQPSTSNDSSPSPSSNNNNSDQDSSNSN